MNTKLKLATSYGVKIPGIYRITNKETHRFYVGKSVNVLGRWIGHYSQEHNPILRNDIEKYGFDGFTFEILEVCEDVKLLSERERFYIETLSNENPDLIYNICIPNSKNHKHKYYDHPLSPEERHRIRSEAGKKGNKNKQVEYEGVRYDSCKALAAIQNVSIQTVSRWIKKGKAKEILTAEHIARRDKRRKQLNSISLEKRREGGKNGDKKKKSEAGKKGGESSKKKTSKKVMDETGYIYDSKKQLCLLKGITMPACNYHIKKGLYKELKTK